MKNLLKSSILLLTLFVSCKKDINVSDTEALPKLNSLPEVKIALMEKIISIAKTSPAFKNTVEQECLKQVRGDYNVALDRLLEIDKVTSIIPAPEKKAFASLVSQMKDFRPGEMPILFVPVMESRDPSLKTEESISTGGDASILKGIARSTVYHANPRNYIIMIDQDNQVRPLSELTTNKSPDKVKTVKVNLLPAPEDPGEGGGGGGGSTSCQPPYYYPGYIIDDYGNLTYTECINEAFAWNNDVWVLGYEEEYSPGNNVISPIDQTLLTAANSTRWDGFPEGGAKIQVLSLGDIEPFVKGKLEFKYFIHNSSGTLIKEKVFGKLRRYHFGPDKWTYLNDFIGYWNIASWGNTTYEHWIEEDGGTSAAFNQTISYVSNGQTYTTTISIPAKNKDDDLGTANVQFTDPVFFIPLANIPSNRTIYNLNYMNMQREIGPH